MDPTEAINELRREMAGQRLGLFLLATVGFAGLAMWNLVSLWGIPVVNIEKFFEDLTGSKDHLPQLSQWVLAYAQAGRGLLPPVVVGTFTITAWSVMLLMRHSWRFLVVATIALLVLIGHALVVELALKRPWIEVVQSLAGAPASR